MTQEKLISIGQFFMEPLQLVCKELKTQEVLLVLFSTYSKGMFVFIAELHPRAKRACGRSPIAKGMW